MEWSNTYGVAVVDLIPGVGHMLEGFASVASQKNIAMTYVPVYTNGDHQDWFETFWFNDLAKSFQRGEFNVAGFERTALSKEKTYVEVLSRMLDQISFQFLNSHVFLPTIHQSLLDRIQAGRRTASKSS